MRYQQPVKGREMTILTLVNHEQNIVITSLSLVLTDTFRFEEEIIISIDLNKIWSEACVLIPGTGGRWWQSGEREGAGQRSLSAAWISYKVFYTKSAINQRACAISSLDQPSQILLGSRGDISDKEFIIKRQGDKIRTLGRYNV